MLALLALAPLPVGVAILAIYTRRAGRSCSKPAARWGAHDVAQETVAGVATVRAYARESEQREHFARAAERVLDASLAVNRMGARSLTAVDMLPLVGSALVVIVGGRLAISGDLSVVDFSVFYTYVVMLVPSVQAVGLTLGQAQPAFAGLRRVLEALRQPAAALSHRTVPAGRTGRRADARRAGRQPPEAIRFSTESTSTSRPAGRSRC